jgi:ATP-dependent Clp protease ATP-binding subunit ClpB
MIRIDMSEYQEKHTVARLIGAPPGYVGYEEGGQLTEAVRRRPYSVVLFDEVEKAHHDVFNVLLQVLDDGRLTDNQGRTVSFKNTIIIMTSNLGASYIMERAGHIDSHNQEAMDLEIREELERMLRQTLRPEFLNRIDEVVVFHALGIEEIEKIVDIQFRRIKAKAEAQGIELKLSESAKAFLAHEGFDPAFGARPLKRTIQKFIANPLATEILSGKWKKGDRIEIVEHEKMLDFKPVNS